jgi:broad specificity phosphatase PhoE
MRHGRTVLDDEKRSDGWLDYPLSDEGRVGLIDAQQYLKHAPIKKVFCSDLRRTHETAHIVSSGILSEPEIATDNNFKTWKLGALMGTQKAPNRPIVQYYIDNPHEVPDGGESMAAFYQRFLPAVVHLCARAEKDGRTYLIVTSGSNIRAISNMLCGNTDDYDLDEAGLLRMSTDKNGDIVGCVVLGKKDGGPEYWS